MKINEDLDHLGNPIPYDPLQVHSKLERWFYLAIALFTIVFLAYFVQFYSYSFSKDPADWGQFGDYIGGLLNPIIAGLILLITVHLQKSFVRFTETITLHQLDSQRAQFNTQVLYELAKDFSQQANAILREVERAHHCKDIEGLENSLTKLLTFQNYWLMYNASLFYPHESHDFPTSHIKNYITHIEKFGKKLFDERRESSAFDLEMVQLCVGVTTRKLYKAIPERAKSREVFNKESLS